MHRRLLIVALVLIALTLPMSASQFIEMPFDQIARESAYIVRGSIGHTWSAWDDAREVIYTYATIHVTRYFGEATGPDTLLVREVGGSVDGYMQEAIGFPVIRPGEEVVVFLSPWDDGSALRIHAFNQGKYLVRQRGGIDVVVHDRIRQGYERLQSDERFRTQTDRRGEDDEPGLEIEELAAMVEAARAGERIGPTGLPHEN